ncbi:hypothetical protein DFH27DRAFT_610290 [Peziza echinospora]|nr:hypothetical protein DFH27DRAFT_610290 [Peziza echinospora]
MARSSTGTSVWIWIIRFLRGILCAFAIFSSVYLLVRYIVNAINLRDDYSYYYYNYSSYWGSANDILASVPWPIWVTISACLTLILLEFFRLILMCIACFTGGTNKLSTVFEIIMDFILFAAFMVSFAVTAGKVFKNIMFQKCYPGDWRIVCEMHKANMWCCFVISVFFLIEGIYMICTLNSSKKDDPSSTHAPQIYNSNPNNNNNQYPDIAIVEQGINKPGQFDETRQFDQNNQYNGGLGGGNYYQNQQYDNQSLHVQGQGQEQSYPAAGNGNGYQLHDNAVGAGGLEDPHGTQQQYYGQQQQQQQQQQNYQVSEPDSIQPPQRTLTDFSRAPTVAEGGEFQQPAGGNGYQHGGVVGYDNNGGRNSPWQQGGQRGAGTGY